ncbi:MAG: hypothetical protein KJ630_03015 [Proteobacteria bacterium]|nr:hypothetical protein [Pseudomonadota bacterium]
MQTSRNPGIVRDIGEYKIQGLAIPYPEFVPRLYNLCLSLGFKKGFIMPSRAFCSDENQGFPIILITKHFGTFPFNHGRVGGIVAADRHGPHAHHGEDSVIVQASHVGYDPKTGIYGTCERPKTEGNCLTPSCGKISHTIEPYLEQYRFAQKRIFLHLDAQGRHLITAKDSFIDFASKPVTDGLVLDLREIAKINDDGKIIPVATHSTSHSYKVSESFRERLAQQDYVWKGGSGKAMGDLLTADLFYFREDLHEIDESILLERNLIEFMPIIVTHKSPPMKAAKINIQMEFARTVETIRRGTEYNGKNLLFIAGLNVDISSYDAFPSTTYFVPWAAHIQLKDSTSEEYIHPLEQEEIFKKLMEQSTVNPDQADLKEQISKMISAPRFDIRTPR